MPCISVSCIDKGDGNDRQKYPSRRKDFDTTVRGFMPGMPGTNT